VATKTPVDDQSERKRLSIPKVDQSVLDWWKLQHDVGLSVRMLIRAEIERNGYVDTVYQPVTQSSRRGRPPASAVDTEEGAESPQIAAAQPVTPVAQTPVVAQPAPAPAPVAAPVAVASPAGYSPIDALMNG